MLRNIVKTITMALILIDTIMVLIANPMVGIGRAVFFAAFLWAWKLY